MSIWSALKLLLFFYISVHQRILKKRSQLQSVHRPHHYNENIFLSSELFLKDHVTLQSVQLQKWDLHSASIYAWLFTSEESTIRNSALYPSPSSIHLCLPFPFTAPLILLRMTDSPSQLRPLIMIMLVFIYLFLSSPPQPLFLQAEMQIRARNVCSVSLQRLSLLYDRLHTTSRIRA